jgi:hypothetical protein
MVRLYCWLFWHKIRFSNNPTEETGAFKSCKLVSHETHASHPRHGHLPGFLFWGSASCCAYFIKVIGKTVPRNNFLRCLFIFLFRRYMFLPSLAILRRNTQLFSESYLTTTDPHCHWRASSTVILQLCVKTRTDGWTLQ